MVEIDTFSFKKKPCLQSLIIGHMQFEEDGYWLVAGTNQMEDWIQKCDSGFNLYHKTDLVTGGSIHKRTERFILMQENCGDIPEKVLKLFVKGRTFHEIR